MLDTSPYQKRLFRVTGVRLGSIGAPSGLHWRSIGAPSGVCQVSFKGQARVRWGSDMHALQMISPNNLSKLAVQYLFTFWNIMILDYNSNHLVLYSILFFDTDVYNES